MKPIEAISRVEAEFVMAQIDAPHDSSVPAAMRGDLLVHSVTFQPATVLDAIKLMREATDTAFEDAEELEPIALAAINESIVSGNYALARELHTHYDRFLSQNQTPTPVPGSSMFTLSRAVRRENARRAEVAGRFLNNYRTMHERAKTTSADSALEAVYTEGFLIRLMRDGELKAFSDINYLGFYESKLPRVFDTRLKANALAEKGLAPLVDKLLPEVPPIDFETLTKDDIAAAKTAINTALRAKNSFDSLCLKLLWTKNHPLTNAKGGREFEFYDLPNGHAYTEVVKKIVSHPWYQAYAAEQIDFYSQKDSTVTLFRKL